MRRVTGALVLAAALSGFLAVVPGSAAAQTSTDATLSGLSVSPGSLSPEFASATTVYTATVGYDVAEVTVSHTANHASATAAVLDGSDATLSDADSTADGFQVTLGDKGTDTVIKVKVTAQDTTTTETYQITVTRESEVDLGNFSYHSSFSTPTDRLPYPDSSCSDGTTVWVSDVYIDKLTAYNKDGSRDSSKDLNLSAGNDHVTGLWCNDTTVWVGDYRDAKIYAYTLSNGNRDSSKDIRFAGYGGGWELTDIWSDGTTMWALNDWGRDSKIMAYNLSTGSRDHAKDVQISRLFDRAPYGIDQPLGMWSDGTTIWVSDWGHNYLWAFNLATGQYDSSKNFTLRSTNFRQRPSSIWFDSTTMWVSEFRHGRENNWSYPNRIYVYERVGGV